MKIYIAEAVWNDGVKVFKTESDAVKWLADTFYAWNDNEERDFMMAVIAGDCDIVTDYLED